MASAQTTAADYLPLLVSCIVTFIFPYQIVDAMNDITINKGYDDLLIKLHEIVYHSLASHVDSD